MNSHFFPANMTFFCQLEEYFRLFYRVGADRGMENGDFDSLDANLQNGGVSANGCMKNRETKSKNFDTVFITNSFTKLLHVFLVVFSLLQ